MDFNSVLTNNPLILSTLESFKNISRSLNMNPLGALNFGNFNNMNMAFNGVSFFKLDESQCYELRLISHGQELQPR
jgi:hypothetical protein